MKSRIRIITALILAMAGLLVVAAAGADVLEESFDADGLSRLYLQSDLGSVDIKAGSDKKITVKVERKNRAVDHFNVEFSREAPTLVVRGQLDDDERDRGHNMGVRFTITVPRTFDIEVDTAGGSVSVDDIDGEADIKTAGGSIKLGQVGGPVNARTAGGSIRLSGSSADATLSTAGGSINIGDINGNVEANTAGGSISIQRAAGWVEARTAGGSISVKDSTGAVNASTAGGSISAYISQQPESDSLLKTSGGGITVYLAENISLDIDAHINHGHIESDFTLDNVSISDQRLIGKLNGGGPALTLKSNGSVRIVRR